MVTSNRFENSYRLLTRPLAAVRRIITVLRLPGVRTNIGNALFGVGDYVTQPLVMLVAAPYLLHHLGLSGYGLWMLATATISSSTVISSGFGDAAVKYAAMHRRERQKLEDILRVSLLTNVILGSLLALAIWLAAPIVVSRVFSMDPSLRASALTAFRIASVILVFRTVEQVFIGAQRAHERYGPSVRINFASRAAIALGACLAVSRGYAVVGIMIVTLCVVIASTIGQAIATRLVIGPIRVLSSLDSIAASQVFSFGCYSWLQAVGGCIFTQADRLLIGALAGTTAVAYYSVCVQAAQPIHGLIASGLHFLFPHLSHRASRSSPPDLKRVVVPVLSLNAILALCFCAPIVLFGKPLLRAWMGPAVALQAGTVLSIVAVSFGLLGLNITGHYALLALGQVRLVSILNLAGGTAMLAVMMLLVPRYGLVGAAIGRLIYGPITLLMYWRLRLLILSRDTRPQSSVPRPVSFLEPEPQLRD